MADIIVINGAPGTGKSTTCKLLQQSLVSPFIELSDLRVWHLDPEWKKVTPEEEQMAFENLVFVVMNYLKNNYKNIILTDFIEARVRQIPEVFKSQNYLIFTLFVTEDDLQKKRVLDETRNSGYRNYAAAIAWNKRERERPLFPNEVQIDTTDTAPEKLVELILGYL